MEVLFGYAPGHKICQKTAMRAAGVGALNLGKLLALSKKHPKPGRPCADAAG